MSLNFHQKCAESNKDCSYISLMGYRVHLVSQTARNIKSSGKNMQNFRENFGALAAIARATSMPRTNDYDAHTPLGISGAIG